jgi:predicted ArsR family transcriptional regulator
VDTEQVDRSITAVAALGDPVRRRLHDVVRSAPTPVTREQAAQAVGISRKLAAFHLDKLVAVGLLRVAERRQLPARVGRAPKLYAPVDAAVSVSVPARSHDELAAILVDAVSASGDAVQEACRRSATDRGRARGAAARTTDPSPTNEPSLAKVERCLLEHGYEPYRDDPSAVRLRNCPFHPLAQQQPALVCAINVSFVDGLIDGLRVDDVEAALVPTPGECCVEVRTRGGSPH